MLVEVTICWFTYRKAFHTYVQNTDNSSKGKRLVPSKIYMGNWIESDKKSQSENYKKLVTVQIKWESSRVLFVGNATIIKKTNHESMKWEVKTFM